MKNTTVKIDNPNSYIVELLIRIGLKERDANILAESLIDADLKGIQTHGLMRLPIYIKRIESGLIDILNKIETVRRRNSIKILNANNTLGQVAGVRGVEEAIICARNVMGSDLHIAGPRTKNVNKQV